MIIHNENEYQQAIARIDEERRSVAEHAAVWRADGFTASEIERLRQPLESFQMKLIEEVERYERLKRGQFDEFENLHGFGQVLIGLRIGLRIAWA